MLVSVEFRFRTTEEPRQLGDRIREAVAMIVGRDELLEFRLRSLPLDEKKGGPGPRAVD
jgi:hypothetical protein